jgi:hypothetical protein
MRPPKILFDFTREAPALKIKGALVGDAVYTAAQTEAFSKLPGRLELISMLMSVMNGPARNLAAALNDIPARLVRTVKAAGDKKAAAASRGPLFYRKETARLRRNRVKNRVPRLPFLPVHIRELRNFVLRPPASLGRGRACMGPVI